MGHEAFLAVCMASRGIILRRPLASSLPVTAVPGDTSGLVCVIERYLDLFGIIRYCDFPRLRHGRHTSGLLLTAGMKAKIGGDTPGRLTIAVRPAVRQPLGIVLNAQWFTSSNITVLPL